VLTNTQNRKLTVYLWSTSTQVEHPTASCSGQKTFTNFPPCLSHLWIGSSGLLCSVWELKLLMIWWPIVMFFTSSYHRYGILPCFRNAVFWSKIVSNVLFLMFCARIFQQSVRSLCSQKEVIIISFLNFGEYLFLEIK
jgi:hypothetical protein